MPNPPVFFQVRRRKVARLLPKHLADLAGVAQVQDTNLVNAWGISFSATSPFWVSANGTGDFNTVQGAMDFIPDYNPKRITVFIKNGKYEEIVYFRNRSRSRHRSQRHFAYVHPFLLLGFQTLI